MISWCKTKLGDCCEIISGSTPSTNVESFWNGSICWATPKDLSQLDGAYISDTPRKLTQSGLDSCGATILPSNSVLFSSRAPIGHVAVNTVPMATNQGFKSFVPKDNRVYAKFLYHWLRKNRAYLESLGNGATFKEVSKTIVSRVEILLPSLEEQKRIAEILDRAEELRSKRREAIAQLDTLTQAIFIEMFGDPVVNPKLHPVVRLGSLTKISSGSTPSRKQPENFDGNIPWVKTTEVNGGLITDTEEKITESALQNSSCHVYPMGSILIALYGQGKTRGQCAVLGIEAATNQACGVLLPNPNYITNFLFAQLSMSYSRLRAMARGGNQENLNLGLIADFTVLLPSLPLQKEFARRIEALERLKTAHRASLSELDALFASLQHRAFRGEL